MAVFVTGECDVSRGFADGFNAVGVLFIENNGLDGIACCYSLGGVATYDFYSCDCFFAFDVELDFCGIVVQFAFGNNFDENGRIFANVGGCPYNCNGASFFICFDGIAA